MKKRKLIKGAVIGVILGTVAGYLLNPKTGKQNQAKVKKVAKNLMARLTAEVQGVKNLTKREYESLIKKIMADFKEDKELNKQAWDQVARELKMRWQDINTEIKDKAKKKLAPKTAAKNKK